MLVLIRAPEPDRLEVLGGLLGGSVAAGRANGDFRVRARLPYGGPRA